MKHTTMIAALVSAGVLFSQAAFAEGLVVSNTHNNPQVERASYVTGGVGKVEREKLEAMENKYNLKVETAYNTGHYVSDAAIAVKDKSGATVINAVADGPLFYANLEAGTYTVEVNYHDVVKTQKVTLPAASDTQKPKRVVFVWPDPEPSMTRQSETN